MEVKKHIESRWECSESYKDNWEKWITYMDKILLKVNNVADGQKMENMYMVGVHNQEDWISENNKYLKVNFKKTGQKEKKSRTYWLKEHIVSKTTKGGGGHRDIS